MKDHTSQWDGQPAGAPARLRELRPGDLRANAGWAVDLLREAPTHRPKPGERQRVLLGLGRPRVVTRRAWPVRLAATMTALLAATAIARAGLGHFPGWFNRLARDTRPSAPTEVRPLSGAIGHRAPAVTAAAPAAEIATAPVPVPEPAVAHVTRATATAHRPARRPPPPTARRDGDGELVVQAMRALRHDDDPPLARALCTAYLQRHPDGPLAEEALALTIEAAVAQHDPGAPALGARYLQRYPNGPFRGLARQAIRPGGEASR
jgi:hypothetical protein